MILKEIPLKLNAGETCVVENELVGVEQYVGLADGSAFPSVGYKVIIGTMMHRDVNQPWTSSNTDVVIMKNTVGNLSIAETSMGVFTISCNGAFPEAKTHLPTEHQTDFDDDGNRNKLVTSRTSDSTIQLACLIDGQPIDGPAVVKTFEVRVYA